MDENPVIIITGASSGIGAAAARVFGRRGYQVILAARRLERLEELENEIKAGGGDAFSVETDVSNFKSLANLVSKSLKKYGQIDVLLNNAGFGRTLWLEEMEPEKDIANQIQVNLTGLIQLTREVIPHMIERRSGHIINTASLAGYVATPTYTVYAATKFGVRGFSDALRRELGVWGIDVSVIYPGGVSTEFGSHTGAKRKTGITTPAFLRLTPEDVARRIYAIARRPKRGSIIPWISSFGAWFDYFLPGLNDWVIERTFTRPERGL